MEVTAVFEQDEGWWIAWTEELRGPVGQGRTLDSREVLGDESDGFAAHRALDRVGWQARGVLVPEVVAGVRGVHSVRGRVQSATSLTVSILRGFSGAEGSVLVLSFEVKTRRMCRVLTEGDRSVRTVWRLVVVQGSVDDV